MTWLALLLKPFIWPLMEFCGRLAARWGAIVVYRATPPGRARDALFDKTLLDRHGWICLAAMLFSIALMFLIWFWPRIWG